MKRKKLERLIAEFIEDREAIIAEERQYAGVLSVAFAPLGSLTVASSSLAPWCGMCQGFHIPGAGPCTRTYTWSSRSTTIP